MQKPQIITHGGITLDVSRIKSFQIDTYNPRERSHILRIEFKSRYEYLLNPGTKQYEQVLINDFIEHPYADYDTAATYRDEWQEIWVDCLQENS
ncbi:MAG: hypothetical protein ABJ092_10570 [Gillisia sp.]